MANNILIRKRKSARHGFTYEYRIEIAQVDGHRRWLSKSGFLTKREAQAEGAKALAEYNSCGIANKRNIDISFSDFLDYWIAQDCLPSLKSVTIANYRKKIDNHIKPVLGGYRLKAIEKGRLQQFLQEMHNNGYARNTLLVIKGIITKSFGFAVDHKFIAFSPAIGLRLPTGEHTDIPVRTAPHHFLGSETMAIIFERFPEGSSCHIPLMIGYHCGMRISEVFALTWENIDFASQSINICKQIQWRQFDRSKEEKQRTNGSSSSNAGCWYFSNPKYNSARTIYMDNALTALLLREKERQLSAKAYYGNRYVLYYEANNRYVTTNTTNFPVHFICVREDGTYINPRVMQHTSSIVHSELNIPDFDFHSLRHTHATMLLDSGAPIKYVQTRLGHKSLSVTLNTYHRFTEYAKQEGNAMVGKIFTTP